MNKYSFNWHNIIILPRVKREEELKITFTMAIFTVMQGFIQGIHVIREKGSRIMFL